MALNDQIEQIKKNVEDRKLKKQLVNKYGWVLGGTIFHYKTANAQELRETRIELISSLVRHIAEGGIQAEKAIEFLLLTIEELNAKIEKIASETRQM